MVASHFSDIAAAKQACRAEALVRRRACDPALGVEMGERLLAAAPPPAGAVVAGFWPLAGEPGILPLLEALHRAGHRLVLPRTPPRGHPLTFHEWRPGDALIAGRFATRHPQSPERRPDWLLVPLLAFDRSGRRLGYGAGYYDRTLAALPDATAIGCAFAALEVPQVPAGEHDIRLHGVATEREYIRCRA